MSEHDTAILDIDVPSNGGDPEPQEPTAPSGSVAERLRALHKGLQGEHHIDIDVPGFAGALVGRYKLIDDDRMKARTKAMASVPAEERLVISAMDQIIESCDSLWFRDSENGKLLPLDTNDDTIRFDRRLAEILDLQVDGKLTARKVVREVFTVDGTFNSASMVKHSNDIGTWMEDVSREVDDEYMGESQAAAMS